ncbi:hypothetical protein [Paenibacillus graminis]|uniref:hypothetical protein n=1 Tax=Paenibacillus graminis TaxID=189425 RepID=UPI002DB7DFA9|nr:hypothetical protein [Paenibacillus graminis]MEC0167704.1 hypothetical protein [Paenibacillus graminis]
MDKMCRNLEKHLWKSFVANNGRNAVVGATKAGLPGNNGRNTVVGATKAGLPGNNGGNTVVGASGSFQVLVGKRELIFPKIQKS